MTDQAQKVVVVGKRQTDPDEVIIVVDGVAWGGWQSVRVTRGIERCPSDFELSVTEVFPASKKAFVIRAGAPCEVRFGSDLVISGYVDRYEPAIASHQHEVRISGRGKCQDLVDCAAEWEGGQIVGSSVLEVARKLAKPYGISVDGDLGPAVGQGGANSIIPHLILLLGETAWEVIDRLCRIAGLLAYEQPDGSLAIVSNPADVAEIMARDLGGQKTFAASGFREAVNVIRARASFSADQRFSNYRAYLYNFDRLTDISNDGNFIGEANDEAMRHRVRIVIAESGKQGAIENAKSRAQWEAARRWGRSRVVMLTTDSWRDSEGSLYLPNMLAAVDLPSLKVDWVYWLISEVTYRRGERGTECDLVLMHPAAFAVQPKLPPYAITAETAQLPNNLGRP